ncbi:MAG TPA: hypothetical protein VHF26_21590 [Trebonia sp.]|nr:hypothetical protein [Trebonia sp.]
MNRQDLTFSQIPAQPRNAVIAAEDKNSRTEGGIFPAGIPRRPTTGRKAGTTVPGRG